MLSTREVADSAGVQPATLRRWVAAGVIPQYGGEWTPEAAAQARVVARMRARGHSLRAIQRATAEGRLAFAYMEELFPVADGTHTVAEASAQTGLEPALIGRIFTALGLGPIHPDRLSVEDLRLLRHIAAVLGSGFPLVAALQLVHVYGQSLAQIADAEVRLFHLYVHEPLMRDGVSGLEMAVEMDNLARDLLPLASPIMDQVHQRFLAHFIAQDVVGHMESDLDDETGTAGRMRVVVAFADLAGYTRLTEEEGDLHAVDVVERFVDAVEASLPEEARVIKTIGDGVMIVGSDPASLTDWSVSFQRVQTERPLPRIGLHYGYAIYRDGDYYGRDVNIAARVAARSAGGEVLVTKAVVEHAGSRLDFERIAEVRLKGFTEPTEVFLARVREPG